MYILYKLDTYLVDTGSYNEYFYGRQRNRMTAIDLATSYTYTGHRKITKDLLQLIKWKDRYGEKKELRLYDVLASVWRDLFDLLNLDDYTRKNIETKYSGDSKQCVRDVIEKL